MAWLNVIAIIAIYLLASAFLTYVIVDFSRQKARRNFREKISKILQSNESSETKIRSIYAIAYHFQQPINSLKPSITYHLNKLVDDPSIGSQENILDLMDEAAKTSAIRSLPEPYLSSLLRTYDRCPESRNDLASAAQYFSEINSKFEQRKSTGKVFAKVATFLSFILGAFKVILSNWPNISSHF